MYIRVYILTRQVYQYIASAAYLCQYHVTITLHETSKGYHPTINSPSLRISN